MNCHEIRRMADAFVDGELKANEHERVENHARQCVDCQNWLVMVKRSKDTVRTKLERGKAPDHVTHRIVRALYAPSPDGRGPERKA